MLAYCQKKNSFQDMDNDPFKGYGRREIIPAPIDNCDG